MFNNKAILIFALLCISFAIESSARKCPETGYWKPCLISYRCSDLEQVVWATDGSSCYVLRNPCYFKSENCNRQNSHMEALRTVTKEECQKLCRTICTFEYRPVCAIYNNVKKTFSNSCSLANYICGTGKTYSLYSESACDSDQPTTYTPIL